MQKFISEHLMKKKISIDCGEKSYGGEVIACADDVVTLKNADKLTHVNSKKILSIQIK